MKLTNSFFLLSFVFVLPLMGQSPHQGQQQYEPLPATESGTVQESQPEPPQEPSEQVNTGDWAASSQIKLGETVIALDSRGSLSFSRIADMPDHQDYQDFVGVSDDQIDKVREKYLPRAKECDEIFAPRLLKGKTLPPDELAKLEDEFFPKVTKIYDEMEHSFVEALTPDQRQRYYEMQLALPPLFGQMFGGDDSFPCFAGYNALDLTEEQQKTLKKVQEEAEPEYRELIREFMGKMRKETETGEHSSETFKQFQQEMQQLNARTKVRVTDFLTGKQIAKIEKISFEVRAKLREIKKEREEQAKNKPEPWKPNDKSWKPGDGVSEEFLEQQKADIEKRKQRRFPRLL